jgi:Zn-dependent protease with chaperone function
MPPAMRPAICSASTSDSEPRNARAVTPTQAQSLAADYYDGRSARAQPVQLRLAGHELLISGENLARRVPVREVQWPERTRHGARVAHLPGAGSLHCADSAAWDVWMRSGGAAESLIVKAQQSWRWAMLCVLALAALLVAGYQWGLPWAARAVVRALPASVDESIGSVAMNSLDQHLMQPSELPAARQRQIRSAFAHAVAALPPGSVPTYELVFRKSRVGPNAFALPGGTIVMTDQLVERVAADEAVLTGVLAHELGHLRHRHGTRLLAQVSALGVLSSALWGDFSTLLASVPVWLGQASYSRDAEREADAYAVQVLKAAGLSPLVMVRFFETMARPDPKDEAAAGRRDSGRSWLGFAIASHPADDERIAFFRAAGGAR